MSLTKANLINSVSRERKQLPYLEILAEILLAPNELGKAGYPILAENSYQSFLNNIPHLFKNGELLLETLSDIEFYINESNESEIKNNIQRAISVLKRVTLTAAVTAPSDLWLLRQIFSTYRQLNIESFFNQQNHFNCDDLASFLKVESEVLNYDLNFLTSRGYLTKDNDQYSINNKKIFTQFNPLDEFTPRNMIYHIVEYFVGNCDQPDLVENFFSYNSLDEHPHNWMATYEDIQIGFRILPLVLAARYLEVQDKFKKGVEIGSIAIKLSKSMRILLSKAGVLSENDRTISELGERIFTRGPGPYGIIHAYHGYLSNHDKLLKGNTEDIWVARGENVSASQDANSKSFKQINDALDSFCEEYRYQYTTFIEHAVGQGEATRQRFERSGEESIQYFGADLEDSAIEKAKDNQKANKLPGNMKFVHNADIGKPEILIQGICKTHNGNLDSAVMVVGNGFHEVRNQDNEKMVEVFKGYASANLILIFTEESGLTNEDLLATGWNTYHAGFRYVHDLSGQGLRPAIDNEEKPGARFSWKKCAELGGYKILEKFTTRTRKVYPHPKKDGYNPAISVNYFCVPSSLYEKLIS
jgi:hypothetical protein